MKTQKKTLKALQEIPGVGPSIARDLWSLGITKVADLKNKNPQKLYDDLCALTNTRMDRCLLYVFRCAVYYASETDHDPKLLDWWAWKNK